MPAIILAGASFEPNGTVPSKPRLCHASRAGRAALMICSSTDSLRSRSPNSAPAIPPIDVIEFIR